jgi:glycosyltransferase involved in cell wall biosynthesis
VYSGFAVRETYMSAMHGIRLTMPSYIDSVPLIAKPATEAFHNAYEIAALQSDLSPPGRKSIINIGGLKSDNKNGVVLARAFALIANRVPNWDLHFYGSDALQKRALEVVEPSLRKRVIFHGNVDDIHAEYSRSQIHVICSFQEGCPNAVCEAMTHGIPSIGYDDCPGTNELIVHEENGLLISRHDETSGLCQSLLRLIGEDALRLRLGQRAYRDARSLFSPSVVFDKWENLLARIASYKGDPDRLLQEQKLIAGARVEHFSALRQRISGAIKKKRVRLTSIFKDSYDAPLVSFVVPLFNKENFVERTLQSIVECNYPNKEIIVVDDCSTDRSADVVYRLKKEIDNIRLLAHDKNRGLSAARNTGLNSAQGTYIQFWDADDLFDKDGLSDLVAEMEDDFSDIGTGVALRDGRMLEWYRDSAISRRRVNFELCPEAFSANSTCFKVYRRKFLEQWHLRFVDGLYMQDAEFNLRAFPRAERITVTPYPLGVYQRFEGSASKIISAARIESCFAIDRLTREDYRANAFEHFEPFRQAKLIQFVYTFFLRRLLRVRARGYRAEDLEVFSPDLRAPAVIDEFITRLTDSADNLRLGTRYLSSREPTVAAAYLALQQRRSDWAYSLLTKSALGGDLLEALLPQAKELGLDILLNKLGTQRSPTLRKAG